MIELCLSPTICHPEPAVHAMIGTLFMKILRKGSIEVILEIKALADKASEDSDEDMAGSDSSGEKTVHSGLRGIGLGSQVSSELTIFHSSTTC